MNENPPNKFFPRRGRGRRFSVRVRSLLALPLFAYCACAAQKKTDGWPAYGGTLAGQHYSADDQINRTNVNHLQSVWTFRLSSSYNPPTPMNKRASFEATPVLWKGVLYFDSPFDVVYALDAATGKLRWSFEPRVDRSKNIYIVASRGVALWHAKHPIRGVCGRDRVFVATLDRRLIALDASSGKPCPGFGKSGEVDLSQGVSIGHLDLYSFTSPPTVVRDTVVLGSSVADNQQVFAASGAIRGFDAITGKQKWSWDPVRWTGNQHPPLSGSGNAWSILSGDPENDLVFVPTGSASVDFYGGARPGDNRDANSIVALRASTGKKVWAFQLVHHDLWDYDTPSEPMLFTFRKRIPAVAVVTKQDMVFVFDRLTGDPLYPVKERPVAPSHVQGERAWPTQPFSSLPSLGPLHFTAADLHLHNPQDESFCRNWLNRLDNFGLFTPPSVHGSLESPGNGGGANWGSIAYDSRTSVIYVRVAMLPYIVRLVPREMPGESLTAKFERRFWKHLPEWAGGDPPPLESDFHTPDHGARSGRDVDPQWGVPFMVGRQPLVAKDSTPCGPPPFGSLVALNLDTGQKLWAVPVGAGPGGEAGNFAISGPIVSAGGLVFTTGLDANLRAFDATTGRELWHTKLPAPSDATPMTFAWRGRQYVIVDSQDGEEKSITAYALPNAAKVRRAR